MFIYVKNFYDLMCTCVFQFYYILIKILLIYIPQLVMLHTQFQNELFDFFAQNINVPNVKNANVYNVWGCLINRVQIKIPNKSFPHAIRTLSGMPSALLIKSNFWPQSGSAHHIPAYSGVITWQNKSSKSQTGKPTIRL